MTLQERALEIALQEVGVREIPPNSNRGPRVEEYQKAVNIQPGLAWCAAFTSWCIWKAGGRPGLTNPHTAWTPAIWDWGKKRQLAIPMEDVRDGLVSGVGPGALFLLYGQVGKEPMPRVKHVGFVVEMGESVVTVEGNTDASGSREGGGVYRNARPLSSLYGFVTYGDYLLPDPPSGA